MAILGVRAALLLLSMAPVFAAVGGALWLSEPLGLRDALAIAAVLAGVALVVNEQAGAEAARGPLSPRARAFGVTCGLIAAIAQASGSLLSRAAMATGVGSDTQKPFAIVVVAGLISRLLLGFFVNPVLYQIVAREGDVLQV